MLLELFSYYLGAFSIQEFPAPEWKKVLWACSKARLPSHHKLFLMSKLSLF